MGRKRSFAEIRDTIQKALENRPMNTHELQYETKTSFATLNRHCEYLRSLGVIGKQVFHLRGDKKVVLWTLTKRGD